MAEKTKKTKSKKVEAYGVKGMASKPWRRTFRSLAALNAGLDRNNAECYGTREEY